MNKVFKVIWSKAKCCYVVASELAKNKGKAPKSGIISRSLVAGVLACALSCGAVMPVYAQTVRERYVDWLWIGTWGVTVGLGVLPDGRLEQFRTDGSDPNLDIYDDPSSTSKMYVSTVPISAEGMFSAGNGITISEDTISAKAGTNVTVNSNGISVTGNGSVASGNTGLIDGGKLYAEVRPSDNGNYVKTAQTTAQNLNALDTQVKANATASGNAIKGLSASGTTITYTKNDGTTGTITTQDTKYTAGSGLSLNGTQFSVNTNGSVASGNTGVLNGGTVYSEVRPTADGTFVKKANTTAANLTALDTASKNAIKGVSASGSTLTLTKGDGTTSTVTLADNDTKYTAGSGLSLSGTQFSVNTNGSVASGNTGVMSGGTVYSEVRPTADGTFVKKANTTAANLTALDTASKNAIKGLSVSGKTITYTKGDGSTGTITTQDTTYTAGSGLTLNGTQFSVNTNGAVASGNTGVLNGGTVYSELRPTANGNYIKTANTTAANLKALDDKIGSAASAAGTYTMAANTVNQNIKALDTQTKANTDAISDLDENKANKDASNIDAQVWANVLGVGTVSATDTRLVNGKTVYNAINNVLHDTNTELEVKSVTAKTMETETLTVTDKITTKDLQSTGHTELNTLTVNGESTFKENVTLEKDLSVTGTTNLHDTNVDGDLDVTGKSNFHDDVTMDKDLKVAGNSEVGGNLSVTGTSNLHDTNVDGKLDVTGESAFHDNVTMDKDLSVAGNVDVAGNSHVGNDLTVDGKTTLKDLLQVEGDAEFKKNASVGGDLSVTGTSNLHDTNVDGKLDVTGESAFHDNVKMDKDLDVAGKGSFGGDLTVEGKTTLKDLLQVEGDAEFKKNASVGGDLSVTGTSNLHDTNVDGKLDVTGESAFHDNVTMDKDLSVAGNADVAGNSHVGKDLTVDGKTTLKDLLQVEGDAEFKKNASVGGDLSVTGTSNLHDTNVDGKLDVTGESAFHDNVKMDKDLSVAGNAGVDKNLTVKGKSDLQGDVAVGGKLDVAGESTFKENVSMEKDLAVAGNADVAGNGSFGGDLTVTGKTTLKDLLSVAGDAEFQKNASVGGDFAVAGASNLHDTNIDGKLDVTGESAFHDNVKMDKDLSVAGNAGVDKNLTVKGKSDLQGDVAVGGKLDVAKAATFKDTVTMEKDLNVKGNADISGNQSVGGDLSVVGLADFGNDVTMQKNLSVAGDTKMEGNADVGKDLHVAGDANFDKDVTVGGTARFGQAIWNEGEENQVEINDTGVRVGLNSTHMDAHGIYAGGHNWDEAKAAMHEDGRIKGIYGSIEKDLEVGGDATVGGTLTADRAVIGGKDVTGEFRRVDDKIAKVGAGAAALAGLQYHAFEEGSKFSMALGMGHYSGKTAGAVGAQYHFNRNVSMNLAGTVGNGENMVSGGLTFRFGASKTPYQKDNDALRRENRELMKRLNNLEKRMEKLSLIEQKKAAFPDIPTDHWARNAAETLKGNGFVEGYPDGEFKGDRRMTRYEYAQMLYRALSKGATVDEEHLKEYEPELRRIHKEKSKQQSIKNAQAAQEQAVKEQAAREQAAQEQAAREQAALEAQAAAQVQQDTAINEAQAPAQPVEQQVVNSEMLPMQPGMSRYDYAQQLFTVLRNGGMIDRSLAQEYEPELKQIIREERAKGTLPQQ